MFCVTIFCKVTQEAHFLIQKYENITIISPSNEEFLQIHKSKEKKKETLNMSHGNEFVCLKQNKGTIHKTADVEPIGRRLPKPKQGRPAEELYRLCLIFHSLL